MNGHLLVNPEQQRYATQLLCQYGNLKFSRILCIYTFPFLHVLASFCDLQFHYQNVTN